MEQKVIDQVWNKAKSSGTGNESKGFRKDECNAWIRKADYGNRNSKYGWEIDHIIPLNNGGSDNVSNLRPLQWKNNASRQDGRLVCAIISKGIENIAA